MTPTSKFGGIPVDAAPVSKFGGIPLNQGSATDSGLGTQLLANAVQAFDTYQHTAQGVGDVIQGLWDMGTKPAAELAEHAKNGEWGKVAALVMESAIPGFSMIVKPAIEEAKTATEYWQAGRPGEAVGHFVAAGTPAIGPVIAGLTETGFGEPPMPPNQNVGPVRKPDPNRMIGQIGAMGALGSPDVTAQVLSPVRPIVRGAVKTGLVALHPKTAAIEALADIIAKARERARSREAQPIPSPTPDTLAFDPEAYYRSQTAETPAPPPAPAPEPVAPAKTWDDFAPPAPPSTAARILPGDTPAQPWVPEAIPEPPAPWTPPTLKQKLEGLSAELQQAILARRAGRPAPVEAQPAPAPAAPTPAPAAPPTLTLADLTAAAQRVVDRSKTAAPAPEPAPAQPVEQPLTLANLAEPAPARPTVNELSAQLNELLGIKAEEPPATNRGAEIAAAKRSPIADKLAKFLHEQTDYTSAKLAELDDPEKYTPAGRKDFYKNLGEVHRHRYEPSEDTIALIRERLGTLEQPATPAAAEPDTSAQPAELLRNYGSDAADRKSGEMGESSRTFGL